MVQLSHVASPHAQVVTSQPGAGTTNVIIMQQQQQQAQPAYVNVNPGTKEWSSGTCSCFNDMSSCEYHGYSFCVSTWRLGSCEHLGAN